MEIEQDIAVKLLQLLPKNNKDKFQISSFNIETVNYGVDQNKMVSENPKDLLIKLIKELPWPRHENLMLLVLEHFNGNKSEAARFFNVSRDKMKIRARAKKIDRPLELLESKS